MALGGRTTGPVGLFISLAGHILPSSYFLFSLVLSVLFCSGLSIFVSCLLLSRIVDFFCFFYFICLVEDFWETAQLAWHHCIIISWAFSWLAVFCLVFFAVFGVPALLGWESDESDGAQQKGEVGFGCVLASFLVHTVAAVVVVATPPSV
ncbi:hypothetical protein VTJ04DRAFT_6241 [Mycothermus thermophilus]|uniref:uncharacterized protein n=1 Tax=Humicola insolens TaxID=85995 RepID=UPI0037445CAC